MALRAPARSSGVSSALKQLREAAGLSVRQIASAIDLPFATYYHYERLFGKDYLPDELVERLARVLETFGVDPAHVRALGRPNEEPPHQVVARSEIAKLPRARLSPAAKALVSKQLADWQDAQDYDQRQKLIERFEITARGIATTLAVDNQCFDELPNLLTEAHIAVWGAIDKYSESLGVPFDIFVERLVTERVTRHIRYHQGYSGAQNPHRWQQGLFRTIAREEARAPQQYGERPIPLYNIRGLRDGPYELGELKAWCRRPPGLLGVLNVFGLSVPGGLLEPWFFQGDLILLAPCVEPIPIRSLTVIAVGNDAVKSGLELVIGRVRDSDEKAIGIVTLTKEERERGFHLSDVVVHKILRVKDLV